MRYVVAFIGMAVICGAFSKAFAQTCESSISNRKFELYNRQTTPGDMAEYERFFALTYNERINLVVYDLLPQLEATLTRIGIRKCKEPRNVNVGFSFIEQNGSYCFRSLVDSPELWMPIFQSEYRGQMSLVNLSQALMQVERQMGEAGIAIPQVVGDQSAKTDGAKKNKVNIKVNLDPLTLARQAILNKMEDETALINCEIDQQARFYMSLLRTLNTISKFKSDVGGAT